MPREHLEFIQTQALPWERFDSASLRPGAGFKQLSQDLLTGATSNLVRYPAGWSLGREQALACDEEFFVVDGELAIGSIVYGPGDYAYLPAGHNRIGMSSGEGATVMTFFEGALLLGDASFPQSGAIEHVQSAQLPWASAGDSKIASSQVGLKVLRLANNGDRTWLLNIEVAEGQPFEINGIETHPCVEETFVLQGDMAMPMGQMYEGAYFWRPPNVPHGPMGTQYGFYGLFRCKEGGPFSTDWSPTGDPIDWEAPYRPVLPSAMQTQLKGQY